MRIIAQSQFDVNEENEGPAVLVGSSIENLIGCFFRMIGPAFRERIEVPFREIQEVARVGTMPVLYNR